MGLRLSLVADIAEALADQLTPLSPALDVQVIPTRMLKPTPPTIDIYPASPFLQPGGFGRESVLMRWTVRARVGANDLDAQTDLLYELMDPFGDLSLRGALLEDSTLGDLVDLRIEDVSGVLPYQDVLDGPVLPGFEITLNVYNRTNGST